MTTNTMELIKEYVGEVKPTNPEQHALAFAYLKGTDEAVTQAKYSKEAGISDRGLRKYISDNQEVYEAELERAKAEAEPNKVDLNNVSRTLTEEQLDKFVQSLINSAIKPNATVKEKAQLIDFCGLNANDLMNLTQVKQRTMRHFIKLELGSIAQYLDTKDLGIQLYESDKLFRGDSTSSGNTQRFVDSSLDDESFKLELMYYGLLFMSIFNQTEHPDLKLLSTALRVDRLEQCTAQKIDKRIVKQFQDGKDIKTTAKKPVTDADWLDMLIYLNDGDRAKAQQELRKFKEANKAKPKAPEVDREQVQIKASEHEDELHVLLSAEDEARAMMRKVDFKARASK